MCKLLFSYTEYILEFKRLSQILSGKSGMQTNLIINTVKMEKEEGCVYLCLHVGREGKKNLAPSDFSLNCLQNKCTCFLSLSVMSDSLQPHGLQPTRLLCPWNSPGQNTGAGCHSLLQGISPAQGLNPGLLYCRQILYCLSHQGNLKEMMC